MRLPANAVEKQHPRAKGPGHARPGQPPAAAGMEEIAQSADEHGVLVRGQGPVGVHDFRQPVGGGVRENAFGALPGQDHGRHVGQGIGQAEGFPDKAAVQAVRVAGHGRQGVDGFDEADAPPLALETLAQGQGEKGLAGAAVGGADIETVHRASSGI